MICTCFVVVAHIFEMKFVVVRCGLDFSVQPRNEKVVSRALPRSILCNHWFVNSNPAILLAVKFDKHFCCSSVYMIIFYLVHECEETKKQYDFEPN